MTKNQTLPHQVRDRVLEILIKGQYQPGNRIPSEPELVSILGVSRPTLREGLRILEQEHVIRSQHGSGRFLVTNPKSIAIDMTRLQSVTELMVDRNMRATIKVVSADEIPADETVARNLKLLSGQSIIKIERIRYAEDNPVIYSIDMLPSHLARSAWKPRDFEQSLLEFIERRWNLFVDHSQTTIRAVTLEPVLAEPLQVSPNLPWILLEQLNLDTNGEPILYSKDYHRGDLISFDILRYRR